VESPVELMYSAQCSVAGSQLAHVGGAITKPWPRCAGPGSSFCTVGRLDLTGRASSATDHHARGGNPVTLPHAAHRPNRGATLMP
jgi:hypothetical protein